jgi:hypothetical protein
VAAPDADPPDEAEEEEEDLDEVEEEVEEEEEELESDGEGGDLQQDGTTNEPEVVVATSASPLADDEGGMVKLKKFSAFTLKVILKQIDNAAKGISRHMKWRSDTTKQNKRGKRSRVE